MALESKDARTAWERTAGALLAATRLFERAVLCSRYAAAGILGKEGPDRMARRSYAASESDARRAALSGLFSWEHKIYREFIKPGDRLLIVGCGTGRDLIPFLHAGHEVVGIDPSSVAYLNQILDGEGCRAEVIEGLVECAPLASIFDVAIFSRGCYASILESSWRIAALRRMRDHLKNGGRTIIAYPEQQTTLQSQATKIAQLAARLSRSDWMPGPSDYVAQWQSDGEIVLHCHHFFTRDEIEREARQAGLSLRAHRCEDGEPFIVLDRTLF